MFALNEGYKWQSANYAQELHGVVYLAASNNAERMRRKPLGDFAWQLFDPQLYLASLDGRDCAKTCARLASFRWFGVPEAPEFHSGDDTQTSWQQEMQEHVRANWPGRPPTGDDVGAAARAALEFQADRGCTHLLAPTPLIAEREDEGETAAQWIDAALVAASDLDLGQPVIATVAVSETVLSDASFGAGGFLDTVLDQVTSREGLGGVYIVVARTQARHPLLAPDTVTRAYAHLTRKFAEFGYPFVFVNFADVFGVACVGLGASGFATGPSQSLRRLSLAAYVEEGGGLPLPHLYSHRAIGEFLPERELEVIARLNHLRRVTDLTPSSSALFDALGAGRPASAVAAWAESKNNVAAAGRHFVSRMIAEGATYAALTPGGRFALADSWLDDAVVNQEFLDRRLAGRTPTTPTYAPAAAWLAQLRARFE